MTEDEKDNDNSNIKQNWSDFESSLIGVAK